MAIKCRICDETSRVYLSAIVDGERAWLCAECHAIAAEIVSERVASV